MPEDEPSPRSYALTPEQRTALADGKALVELEKLKAETAKLKEENERTRRLWSATGIMSGFVSFAAVAISVAQLWMAGTAQIAANRRAEADAQAQMERNTSDTRLRCMDTALKAADYAAKLRDDFVKAGTESNPERQVALMNVVIAVFPPGTARRILQAAASEGSTPAVQQRYDEARTDLPSHDDVESCPTSSLVLPGVPKEQTTLAALPTISFTPQNCPPNPPAPPLGLTVFPQIVRPEDKAGAQQILAGLVRLVPNTNVQAIESVPSRSPETAKAEIRYYYRDQADTADRLRKLLAQVGCLEGRGGLGAFEARYIGDRFSNLPRDRMELWFPALNQPN